MLTSFWGIINAHLDPSTYPAAVGVLPPSSAISNMPTFALSGPSPLTFSASDLAPIPTPKVFAGAAGLATSTPTSVPGQAMLLSSALPPIAAKVVAKIKSGQYVPMQELLADKCPFAISWRHFQGPSLTTQVCQNQGFGRFSLPSPGYHVFWHTWQSLHLTPGLATSSPMGASWSERRSATVAQGGASFLGS